MKKEVTDVLRDCLLSGTHSDLDLGPANITDALFAIAEAMKQRTEVEHSGYVMLAEQMKAVVEQIGEVANAIDGLALEVGLIHGVARTPGPVIHIPLKKKPCGEPAGG